MEKISALEIQTRQEKEDFETLLKIVHHIRYECGYNPKALALLGTCLFGIKIPVFPDEKI